MEDTILVPVGKDISLEGKAKELMELEVMAKSIKAKILEYKTELLEYMQKHETLGLKTETYTLTRAKKVTPQVVDFDELKESLDKADIPVMTKEVFDERMTPVFKTLIEEGREMPGLDSLETEYIMVRVKEFKKKGGE